MSEAQQNNDSYTALWKEVQKLESEALTKSALKVVETISAKAKKEKNSPQIVKALLYSSKYALTLEEDAQLKIVNDFKSEIKKAEFPTKNVLESYLANLFWQYFQQNRYQFYNRTKTEQKVDPEDFRTWDLTTLFYEIDIHFEKSLENEEKLKSVMAFEFDVILNEQPNSKDYRPTLFDLLAHTALEFYKTRENNITRPADKFEIDDPEILCEAGNFLNLKIATEDKTSLQAKALKIYQNATFENKEERLLEVLQNSANSGKGSLASTLYTYEIAALYQQIGQTYNPKGNTEHRWKLKEAVELCNGVIKAAPDSRGAEKCKALKSQILAQTLRLTNEQIIPVNKPSR